MLVLVTAGHVPEPAFFQRLKSHLGSIMITGKEVSALMGEPLPALKPECLVTELHWASVDKEHTVVIPFHRHGVEDREKRGVPELFMTVGAGRIAATDHDAMKVCMVVVSKHRYETALARQGMDLLERFLRPAPPVEEVSQINEKVDWPESIPE
jgi:hypothetical protein